MALRTRRKRTINPKYLSEDFESVFSEKKALMSEGGFVVMHTDNDAMVVQDGGEVVQETVEYGQV